MKLFITAGILCTLAIGCSNNETKKEETTATVTDTTSAMTTAATDNSATPAAAPLDSATMMKKWGEYMTPGDMHKMISSWDGVWKGETTMWQTPTSPAMTSTGTATNKMVLGGRYQMSTHKGSFMGMAFEGMGTLAYDNIRKVFVSSWIDNFGTGLMTMEGTWDDATKSLSLKGKTLDCNRFDGSMVDMREVLKIVDDKHQVMEMYGPAPDGKEFKMMEIKMTKS